MRNRSSKAGKPEDSKEAAFRVLQQATEEADESEEHDGGGEPEPETPEEDERGKNPAAVALGRLGGLKGGPARAKNLTPQRRKEIARKAARARWEKERDAGRPPPDDGG